MDIGNNIRIFRLAQKMTQVELAEKLNTRPATISQYENNRTDLQVSTLVRIADALGVTLVELIEPVTVKEAHASRRRSQLLKVFDTLNEPGQKEALHLLHLLTEISKMTE